jgi:hypothetical protein
MHAEQLQEWNKFLAGEWTLEPPKEAGSYHVADRLGHQTGEVFVAYKTHLGLAFTMAGRSSKDAATIWAGYFWSVPTPQLPPPPKLPPPSDKLLHQK